MDASTHRRGERSESEERTCWDTLQLAREKEDEDCDMGFMAVAYASQANLTELNREKRELEQRAFEIHKLISIEHHKLEQLNHQFQQDRHVTQFTRKMQNQEMHAWLNNRRRRAEEQQRREDEARAQIAAAALAAPRHNSHVAKSSHARDFANENETIGNGEKPDDDVDAGNQAVSAGDVDTATNPSPAPERQPLTTQHTKFLAGGQEAHTNGTATPASSRRVSRDMSSGPAGSTMTDDTAGEEHAPPHREEEEQLTPITRANLVVKHDGKIFTHPECMEGVPVEKINPTHPYWDPSWPEIVPLVETAFQAWQVKQDAARDSGQKHSKFQTGRQVNRGNATLKFLQEAEFHPYQLVSKKYMTPKLSSYDTIFRLVDTLDKLKEFKSLDITPLEWLRQRLQEIIDEQGSDFNLNKTIHGFYHDPKYAALRFANGQKSIGRPSGNKMTPKDATKSFKTTPNGKKRRLFLTEEFPTATTSPQKPTPTPTPNQSQADQSQAQQDETERSVPPTPELAKQSRRPKKGLARAMDPDLAYEGYTDVDDFSKDSVGKHDWALNRIKSRLNTAGTGVTQYWHWIPDYGEYVFEHQVLAEGHPLTWGIYANPINFHLELNHIQELRWADDTTKVMVMCKPDVVISEDGKPRGDLMAEFKRQRTKRRFLVFCRKKGVALVKIDVNIIEKAWAEYKSPEVPAMPDSDTA